MFNKNIYKQKKINPPLILVIGFGILIILGAILLSLPIASRSGVSIGFVDAFFTSVSAVCVTGLVVVNTAVHWSGFGKVVIITLIQMGGLGIMTMATIGFLFLGKKISFKERLLIREQMNQESLSGLVKLTKHTIFVTLLIEAIGALLLSFRFIPIYGISMGLKMSIFHSISAFCNAGFDITGNSMLAFSGDIVVNMVISALVIIGGIGFTVIIDLQRKKGIKYLSLHSKLVISISLSLLFIGTILIFLAENNNYNTIESYGFFGKLLRSFFQATITRTAGFNSIDISKIRDVTAFIFIILMFIGGSPGSTAGGIKTTTFGVLILSTFSVIKGSKDINAYRFRISNDVIKKSLALMVIATSVVILVALTLIAIEPFSFLDILFETTSAFGTVGLSRGITPDLSSVGKIVIAITMFIGRLGTLTLAFAFSKHNRKENYRYAEGNVIVG